MASTSFRIPADIQMTSVVMLAREPSHTSQHAMGVGEGVGTLDGVGVGAWVGGNVGRGVGASDGSALGAGVGVTVGDGVGGTLGVADG